MGSEVTFGCNKCKLEISLPLDHNKQLLEGGEQVVPRQPSYHNWYKLDQMPNTHMLLHLLHETQCYVDLFVHHSVKPAKVCHEISWDSTLILLLKQHYICINT